MEHGKHQFIEMKSRSEHGMASKDVMCPDCGEQRRLHEDGRMETMKKGKEEEKGHE